ncbi:hypothetical protein OGATHE_000510 [Ogataea polymorpha]|uniref:Bacteriophage T5 Orf172 DNA-binding domain-containing protein n=1 Tax=Ogataea polymorpha TaxID=460523 RepID=A0A9P8TGU5_9ASCO|nr:hypothetical protein OGATHE_000510 [Ogataea polymorpha]
MQRCLGTTAKGERCKIVLKQEAYCKYHRNHKADPNGKAGYVYIFTLRHLIDGSPKKQTWLRQAGPNPENQINFAQTSVFDPKRHILIKVGYTTQRVRRRLSQWRERCKQDFQLLTPQTVDRVLSSNRDKLADFMERFKSLSLRSYNNYDSNEQAFKASNAFRSEQQVHAQLRIQSFKQVRMTVVISRKEPVDIQRAQVLLVERDQCHLELLSISLLHCVSVSLVLVLSGKQVHGELQNGVHWLKNVAKQQKPNNNRLLFVESKTLVQRFVVDECSKQSENSKDVGLVDKQQLGSVRQEPVANLMTKHSDDLLHFGGGNQSIIDDNLLGAPWKTHEVGIGVRGSLRAINDVQLVQREFVSFSQLLNLGFELTVCQRLELIEQWLDKFRIDNDEEDLDDKEKDREIIHEPITKIVNNFQETSKNWSTDGEQDKNFFDCVCEP